MAGSLGRTVAASFTILVVGAFFIVFFMAYGATREFHWELLAHACLISIVLWMITRAPNPTASGRCPACQSRVFPTRRSLDNARVWTCSGCAFEIPRTWIRPRSDQNQRPPGQLPPSSGPNNPGLAP